MSAAILVIFPLLFSAVPSAATVDDVINPLIDAKSPGAAVMVRRAGQTLVMRGYGVSDRGTQSTISPETNFRLASFSKQFTATVIMLLVHAGKLRYDRTLTDVFPDFPDYGRTVTIRHLLTHTSGLPAYEDLMGPNWSATHQIHDDDVFTLLKKETGGRFAPGTRWEYSNSGYVMLGLIAAKVSGQPFPQLLRSFIFRPLQMDSSLAYVNGQNTVAHRAYGYSRHENGQLAENDQSSTSATLGDGGVYSNLIDLGKWDDALHRHTLLSAEETSAAYTPVKLADGSSPVWPAAPSEDNLDPGGRIDYGFGWFLNPYHGHARSWHSGTTCGFRTVIDRFPAEQLSIVILMNRTDLDPTKLALQIADIFLAKAPLPVHLPRPANAVSTLSGLPSLDELTEHWINE